MASAAAQNMLVTRPAAASARRQAASAPAPRSAPARRAVPRGRVVIRAAGPTMEEQQKIMSENEKRWRAQVASGKVRSVTAAETATLIAEGWKILDVRPVQEYDRAHVPGSVHVPIFVVDDEMSPGVLLKQATAFGMGGWWAGGMHMKPNPRFLADAVAAMPKDSKVIVACQKGMRSLAACEQLVRNGYAEVAWLNSGYDAAESAPLPVEGALSTLPLAGVAGLSAILGWTKPQQAATGTKGAFGGVQGVLGGFTVILVLDVAWFAYDQFVAYKAAHP